MVEVRETHINNIGWLRRRVGITQKELASKCNVSVSLINKYENGYRDIRQASYKLISQLESVLVCKASDLYDENIWLRFSGVGDE